MPDDTHAASQPFLIARAHPCPYHQRSNREISLPLAYRDTVEILCLVALIDAGACRRELPPLDARQPSHVARQLRLP